MVSSFTAVISLALIFVAGMVYDGGQRISTQMQALDLSSNASRAAAQAADPASLYDDQPGTWINQEAASQEAEEFLDEAGYGDVPFTVATAGDQVTVSVTLQQTSVILTWLGTVDITESATATAVRGVEEPNG